MRTGFANAGAALIALLPLCAMAQETLSRSVEMPGQRALMALVAEGAPLAPFATDGCSGGMSATWHIAIGVWPGLATNQGESPPWEACCVRHDRAYHDAGGARTAEQSYSARLAADSALRDCVRESGSDGYGVLAEAMYGAVRIGGGPCTGLPWRWGYGYPDCSAGGQGNEEGESR